jgi:hypothetical protein
MRKRTCASPRFDPNSQIDVDMYAAHRIGGKGERTDRPDAGDIKAARSRVSAFDLVARRP